MKFTIGKKIGLGFAALLLILTVTGGYAILRMRQAAKAAQNLSASDIAEWGDSQQIYEPLNDLMLAARSFGFTGDKVYLESARAATKKIRDALQAPPSAGRSRDATSQNQGQLQRRDGQM